MKVIPRIQTMAIPYSSLATKIVWLCKVAVVLFTYRISGEEDNVLPSHNSMQHCRLEYSHNRKYVCNWGRISLTNRVWRTSCISFVSFDSHELTLMASGVHTPCYAFLTS